MSLVREIFQFLISSSFFIISASRIVMLTYNSQLWCLFNLQHSFYTFFLMPECFCATSFTHLVKLFFHQCISDHNSDNFFFVNICFWALRLLTGFSMPECLGCKPRMCSIITRTFDYSNQLLLISKQESNAVQKRRSGSTLACY